MLNITQRTKASFFALLAYPVRFPLFLALHHVHSYTTLPPPSILLLSLLLRRSALPPLRPRVLSSSITILPYLVLHIASGLECPVTAAKPVVARVLGRREQFLIDQVRLR